MADRRRARDRGSHRYTHGSGLWLISCLWECYPRNGCRICSQSTINTAKECLALFNLCLDEFRPLHNRGRIMDSKERIVDKAVVERVDVSRQVCAKEDEVGFVIQQSHGCTFSECIRYNPYRLSLKRKNSQWWIFLDRFKLNEMAWRKKTGFNNEIITSAKNYFTNYHCLLNGKPMISDW